MQSLRPTRTDHCKVICRHAKQRPASKDLPGLQSHVRYSIFKEQKQSSLDPAREKADAELTLGWKGSQLLKFCERYIPAAEAT